MSRYLRFIGIDPGPTPGIVCISAGGDVLGVIQCGADVLFQVVRDVLDADGRSLIAIERFVARGRASAEQSLTRDQVGNAQALFPGRLVQRSASEVKPWATDARLEAAGLLEATKGMRHAKDAARHSLFAAVKDGGLPDPLSKNWSNR